MSDATEQRQAEGRTTDNRSAGIGVRPITEEERGLWGRALNAGFMQPQGDGHPDFLRCCFAATDRAVGAFDDGRIVGTFRSFAQELTVPGGAVLPTDAITNVTVSATHRRRGLLTRMMRHDLDAAVARGDAAATLIAAEYGIYGRFGFGPATAQHGVVIDKVFAGARHTLPRAEPGSISLVTMEEYRELGPKLHERFRRTRPGAVSRTEAKWALSTGVVPHPSRPWKEPLVAVHRDAAGEPDGVLVYRFTDREWRNWLPDGVKLHVLDHFAVDARAAGVLWRYALEVDWAQHVVIDSLPDDDPLRLQLENPRAAHDHGDSCDDLLWVRVLDVERCFGARRYAGAGRFVMEVQDRQGYAAGRYAVESDAEGRGRCVRTEEAADLVLDVGVLGALLLDHLPLRRLVAAGRVRSDARAAAAIERLLAADARPWCPDVF